MLIELISVDNECPYLLVMFRLNNIENLCLCVCVLAHFVALVLTTLLGDITIHEDYNLSIYISQNVDTISLCCFH